MTTDAPAFRWRTVAVAVYGPSLVFALGEGAVLPMIPHIAEDLGASLAVAAFIAAILTIGELLGTFPAGWIVPRIGERAGMILASVLALLGSAVAYLVPSPVALGFGVLCIGVSASMFHIARQAFLTVYVPMQYRARALSTLGGALRLGMSLGPFAIAAAIGFGAGPMASFILQGVAATGIIVLLVWLKDPEQAMRGAKRDRPAQAEREERPQGMVATVRRNARVLGTLGVASAAMMALRQSRQVILPLWGVAIGVDADATAIIIGIAAFLDFALFYTGGWVMDRFSRMWIVMPVTLGLSFAHLLLAATALFTAQEVWFIVVAILLALANGLGAGVLMTLSADLAEPENPAPFLAVFRLAAGLGGAAAPLILSGVTALVSLPAAAIAIGAVGLGGSWLYARYLPRYDPRVAARGAVPPRTDGVGEGIVDGMP